MCSQDRLITKSIFKSIFIVLLNQNIFKEIFNFFIRDSSYRINRIAEYIIGCTEKKLQSKI